MTLPLVDSDLPATAHALAPMLRKLRRASTLSAADEQAVLSLPYTTRSLAHSAYIVREGDDPKHCCLLLSGFAHRNKVVRDGGRQILSIHMPGDLVDLQNSLLGRADHNVQAFSRAEVALIPIAAIRDLAAARPAVRMALWHQTLVEESIEREWAVNIGRRDARTRLAHLLCELGVRLSDAGLGDLCEYELPVTQEQLADCTGLTPVHVNRTLMALDMEGLTRRAKRAVVILDWKRLAKAGDFSADYLHRAGEAR